jgi:hypothetical protein
MMRISAESKDEVGQEMLKRLESLRSNTAATSASTAATSAEMSSTPVVDWAAKLDLLKKAASERLSS